MREIGKFYTGELHDNILENRWQTT